MSRCESSMRLANKNLSCIVMERTSDRRLRKQNKVNASRYGFARVFKRGGEKYYFILFCVALDIL